MKKTIIIFIVILSTLSIVSAQIEFSGFFDINYQCDISSKENLGFNYGQFELDISSVLSDYVQIEGAIAYNPDEEKMELGAGFVDFHLFGDDEEHPARGGFLNHSGLMIGQFDVPFGLDYLSIPSPDRKIVNTPLLNEMTINCWNDFGLSVYGANDVFNFVLYSVNGFNGGVALGGRTGYLGLPWTEVGFSIMADVENMNSVYNNVMGFDLLSQLGNHNELKFEYQISEGVYLGEQDDNTSSNKHEGFYVQYFTDFVKWIKLPVFAVFRYGAWNAEFDKDENGNDDYQNRYTFGIGYRVAENAEFRLEYLSNQIEDENRTDLLTIQTVVSF